MAPAKRKDDDDDSDTKSEKPIVHSFDNLRDEGEHFLHVKKFKKAMTSFTKALELKADDAHCLISRSKCYLKTGEFEKALTDAENALNVNTKNPMGIHQKAEVLYVKSDFETALVFFHRGHHLRPDNKDFSAGISKCEEAINNAVGDISAVRLSTNVDLTAFYEHTRKPPQQVKVKQAGIEYKRFSQDVVVKKMAERTKSTVDDKTIKKLLGKIYDDREYLENYLKEEDKYKTKLPQDDNIKEMTIECLNYLDTRSEFWEQQNPLYARRKSAAAARRSTSNSRQSSRGNTVQYVLKCMDDIDAKQAAGEHKTALRDARKLLAFVDARRDSELSMKQEVLGNLYSFLGNAYLDQGQLDQAMQCYQKDMDIGQRYHLEEAISRSMDNVGRVHALRRNYKKAIEIWEQKLSRTRTALEATWLNHELGRCYLELRRYPKALDYGSKSLAHAKEIDDVSWQLSAGVLLAQAQVELTRYQEASETFKEAYKCAESLSNDAAQRGIANALEKIRRKQESEGITNMDHVETAVEAEDKASEK